MSNFYLTKNQAHENTEFWVYNSEKEYCDTVRKIIKSKPFGDNKFYIFQFVKRVDDTTGIKKMFHQPRLTKPLPLPGTTLLRVDPQNPDIMKIMWTLPNQENFSLYMEGKMFAEPFVHACIQRYRTNIFEMMQPEPDDLTEEEMQQVYADIKRNTYRRHSDSKRQ